MPARIFIVGSCVSRDAFRLPNDFKLIEYVARTSFSSAFEQKPFVDVSEELLEAKLSSPFQRRLVSYDTQKKLSSLLLTQTYDAILVDLIDERFDVIKRNGAVATLSSELATTGVQRLKGIIREKPLDQGRMERWSNGIAEIQRIAKERGVPIILNRARWAFADNLGKPFDEHVVAAGNKVLDTLYARLRSDLLEISYPEDLLASDSQHIWGRSPFHFVGAFYEHTLQTLRHILS